MSYAEQDNVIERLQIEAKRVMLDRVERPARDTFLRMWSQTKRDTIAFVRGLWSEPGTMDTQAFRKLNVRNRVNDFIGYRIGRQYRGEALAYIERAMRHAYRLQSATELWILDQVTPPNVKVRPRRSLSAYAPVGRPRTSREKIRKAAERVRQKVSREAWHDTPPAGRQDVNEDTGQPQSSYETWLDAWLKSWASALASSVALGAVSSSSPDRISRDLDYLRVGGRTPEQVLDTMIQGQVNVAVDDAQDDVHDDWGDVLTTRIWLSKNDARVCPICAKLDGMTEEQVAATYPDAQPGLVHGFCRCRWSAVPRDFQAMAGDLANPDADPRAMTILDPDTKKPMASVVVSFGDWQAETGVQ
ncbi:MAG TPA: hypothetical protein VNI57_01405 [Candidatus Saccharimonadales bacterium]|nr:hypothetical protein [Candidatus Saccharimonadales bacterium]